MIYTSESIYWVYFSNSQWIKTIWDLRFDESYTYKEMGLIVVEKSLFYFLKLELLIDSIFNTFVRDNKLFTTSLIPWTSHLIKDNSDSFFPYSLDDNFPSTPQKSILIHH